MDTSNFDLLDAEKLKKEDELNRKDEKEAGKSSRYAQHAFYEFTFRRFFDSDGQAIPIRTAAGGANVNGFNDNGPRQDDSSEASSLRGREANNGPIYACGTDSTMSETTSSQVSVGDLYDEVCINEHPNTSASTSSANSTITATNSGKETGNSTHNGEGTDSDSAKGDQDPSNNPVFV